MQTHGRYVLELAHTDQQRTPIGQFDVTPEWEWADQAACFAALRSGRLAPGTPAQVLSRAPVWSEIRGKPYMKAVRIGVTCGSRELFFHDVSDRYFKAQAQSTATSLASRSLLAEGTGFEFAVLAYPDPKTPADCSRRAGAMTYDVRPRPLVELRREAVLLGDALPGDVPVFLPRHVVDEGGEMTLRAGAKEIGGVLIGHLCRATDAASTFFVEVTALIPAPHTLSESTTLTFQPQTWSAVLAATKLRGRGEQMVGWFHSHPAATSFCNPKCPPAARERCPLARKIFFSDLDVEMHKRVFPPAYAVALVCTNTLDGLRFALYGWSADGTIVQRAFHVVQSSPALAPVPAAPAGHHTIGGTVHAACAT